MLANADGLTVEEITANCVHLLTAGHETTTNLLGKITRTLLARPDLADRLRTAPDLTPAAVGEFLRHDPPVQLVTRWATEEQSLGGRRIGRGDKVTLVLGSANRDPLHFPEPDEVVFSRDVSRHAAFGMGVHYCLGAQLARAEAEIALPVLLDLLPGRAVAECRYAPDMVFHGPDRLVLTSG